MKKKKQAPKNLPTLNLKPQVKKTPSKPKKTRLSRSDPDFFKKLGQLSAEKRTISHKQLSDWGKLGHVNRDPSTYRGGRPKTKTT